MLQNMLIERFGLKFHQEQKEVQGYQLVVGKNGPKFKESAPELPKDSSVPNASAPSNATPTLGSDGFPALVPGVSGVRIIAGRGRAQLLLASIPRLVTNLARWLGAPVIDGTSLGGQYDLSLYWVSSEPMRPDLDGPSLFEAVQNQLGLKLESKRVIVPMIFIDHCERRPTEN
jgi:uncharacterized protein (TIGR03435 family)